MTTPENQPPQDPYGQQPQQPYGQTPPQPPYGTPQPVQPQGQQWGQQPYVPRAAQINPAEERTWASASHWGALLIGLVTSGALCWVVPLVVMLTKGKESPFVMAHAKESLNFQISAIIYGVISVILIFVLVGVLLLLALAVFYLVVSILASIKASNGEPYRYPLTIRFVN